jgi:hypothetical protein
MEPKALERIDLFYNNTLSLKGKLIFNNPMLKRLTALLYASENKVVNYDEVKRCYDLIKSNAGFLSAFKGNTRLTIAALLSLKKDPEIILQNALLIYKELKNRKFIASDFLVIAAYQIASNANEQDFYNVIERTRAFYEGMKADHPFVTGMDDYIFSAMLALSDVEIDDGLKSMEELFSMLKPIFKVGMGVQSLSQVLTLGNASANVGKRVIELYGYLKELKVKPDRTYSLSSLGILALLPGEISDIAKEIFETSAELKSRAGFGAFSVTKQERLLISSGLVALNYLDRSSQGTLNVALFTSITNIIIAQQAAMAAAIASSAAASAAATN